MKREDALERIRKRGFAFDFYSVFRMLGEAGLKLGEQVAAVPFDRTYFPASVIQDFLVNDRAAKDAVQVWVFLNVFGLYGASGCLPYYFNDVIYEEQLEIERARDTVDDYGVEPGERLRPFLGLLNERLYYYLYKAWTAPRLLEADGDDIESYQSALLSLAGLAVKEQHRSLLLSCVTFFAHSTRSPWGLEQLLQTVFQVLVKVEENIARKIEMDPSSYSLLNQQWAVLGKSLILGKITTVCALFFRVVIGPVALPKFAAFLPGGKNYALLMNLINIYIPMHLEYELDLVLESADVPKLPWTLGRHPCRLGLGIMLNPALRTEGLTAKLKSPASAR